MNIYTYDSLQRVHKALVEKHRSLVNKKQLFSFLIMQDRMQQE